jgi:hypothetical protein
MFGLNLFTVNRFFESTTLLWLTAVVVALVGAGGFLAISSPGSTIEKVGYSLAGFGILLLIVFLIYGYYVVQQMPGTCIVCPSTPLRLTIQGNSSVLPISMNLPEVNPYENTFIYYVSIPSATPSKTDKTEPIRFIRRPNHFGLSLDPKNGTLYLDNGAEIDLASSPVSKQVGQLPFQTITQIAIIQNQKTFSVCINGKLSGVQIFENLPYQPGQSTLINESGGIRVGMIYHVELHRGQLTREELRDHWESMRIAYVNDTRMKGTYSGNTLPGNDSQSWSSWITGIFRVFFGKLGFVEGSEVAMNSIKNV